MSEMAETEHGIKYERVFCGPCKFHWRDFVEQSHCCHMVNQIKHITPTEVFYESPYCSKVNSVNDCHLFQKKPWWRFW